VDETLRLVQAFQFTDLHGEGLTVYIGHVLLMYSGVNLSRGNIYSINVVMMNCRILTGNFS